MKFYKAEKKWYPNTVSDWLIVAATAALVVIAIVVK